MGREISSYEIRKIILEESNRAHVGHIGCSLSIADIVCALFANILSHSHPDEPNRDRVILSKGHAALAVYAALYLKGWLDEKTLHSYCTDGSLLGVHPDHALRGIDFSTGSLGHGLSMGVGAALAARLQKSSRRVFVILSDAECNEGSLWEAVMFASHHNLSNLTAIIDLNGQQALGYTEEILDLSPMAARWQAFGWNACEVDGHDVKAISETVLGMNTSSGKPHAVIAHTTFGKGVSFMENKIKWHYFPMSGEEYDQALEEIKRLE